MHNEEKYTFSENLERYRCDQYISTRLKSKL